MWGSQEQVDHCDTRYAISTTSLQTKQALKKHQNNKKNISTLISCISLFPPRSLFIISTPMLMNDYENKTLPSPVDFILKAHTGSFPPYSVCLDFVSHNAAGGCSSALTATAARLLYERDPRVGAVTRCSAFLRLAAAPRTLRFTLHRHVTPRRDFLLENFVCNWCLRSER